VKKLVKKELEKKIRHDCFTCKYFTFKVEDGVEQEGVGNRGCRCPEPLKVNGVWTEAVCLNWELQPDPRKRKRSFINYYPEGYEG
jgi:hypothetical protein